MAPIARSSGVAQKKNNGVLRGIKRSSRGQGRGRGRSNYNAGTESRRSFHSTRVEEQLESDIASDTQAVAVAGGEDHVEDYSESSSDSGDEVQFSTAQKYSSLLQSLHASPHNKEPSRKKQKFSTAHQSEKEETFVRGVSEQIAEPEEVEGWSTDDADIDELEQGQDHDPFLSHLDPQEEHLMDKMNAVKENQWLTTNASLQSEWSCALSVPHTTESNPIANSGLACDSFRIAEYVHLKQRLIEPATKLLPSLDNVTQNLAVSILYYQDILFDHRTLENGTNLRNLACLHALNHVFKTRDQVIKNSARLAKDTNEDIEFRDQGFTRPKVLIIVPTRNSCSKYVETIVSLCEPEQQENRKRFQESYASGTPVSEEKPEDFRELFNGNDDDMFRLGLKFTRKTIKFFATFYNSDIIFASPLGLRMALGADDTKKQDDDFLSSIEILILDQADAIQMQNWEHIEYIFDHLNLQPKEAHGCDFSRVRNWYLDGNAKYLRQTILFSAFNFPSLNSIYTHRMLNVVGKLKYARKVEGAMTNVGVSSRQTFSRFDYGSTVAEPDNRFNFFITAIFPSISKKFRNSTGKGQGVLIYLPSYADFARVRNYLATSSATQNISFGSVSEYTSVRDVARARSHFASGRHSILLYTERAHHFRRYHLKGVKSIIMYGLPENPLFYKEVVGGFLGATLVTTQFDATEASVKALFSVLDTFKLERIVGTGRHLSMLKQRGGDTFDFI